MDSRLHTATFEQVLDLGIVGCKAVGEHIKSAINARTKLLAGTLGIGLR